MPTIVDTEISKPARITGRVVSGVVVLFLLFDGAIKLSPGNPTALLYRAQVQALRGDTTRAIDDYSEALRSDSNNPRIYASRAALYNNLGDFTAAIDDLNQAIRLRPKDPNQFLSRGIAYFSKGDYAKAVADYDEALKLDPRMVPALNNRCLTRAVAGQDLDGALADCTEALKLQPNDPYTRDNLGLIYLKRKQYERAIAEYDASLKIDPNRARALYGRGFARSRKEEGPAGANDMSAAAGIQSNIASEFARYGIR